MITVKVNGIGSEMQGVARLDDGRAVFIPFALPEEEVSITLTRQKDRYALAKLERVLTPSLQRREPDCPYYGCCGGCQLRHISYAQALEFKREKVCAALTRLGGLIEPTVLPALPSPQTDAYRNKAEFACARGNMGVYREGSAEVIDIEGCRLQSDFANRILGLVRRCKGAKALSGIVTRVNAAGEGMLILCSHQKENGLSALAKELCAGEPSLKSVYACFLKPRPAHALDGSCTLLLGQERLNETLCDLTFSVSPQAFFQVNRLQAERLYETALSFAELRETDSICDIYCGVGTITLCAAQRCKSVIGIEIVPEAISDARKNAHTNRLSAKTQFLCADAAQAYPPLARKEQFSAVFVDPPRKGLDKAVVDALIAAPTEKLIYVSCDPATLARDIKLLTQSGTYRFVKAQPVDMFPGTSHVETVCCLYHQKKDFISVPYEPKNAE